MTRTTLTITSAWLGKRDSAWLLSLPRTPSSAAGPPDLHWDFGQFFYANRGRVDTSITVVKDPSPQGFSFSAFLPSLTSLPLAVARALHTSIRTVPVCVVRTVHETCTRHGAQSV